MAKNKEYDEEQDQEQVKSTVDKPICVVPMYKEDVEKLGFVPEYKNTTLNAEIRNKVRKELELPVRVRTTGSMALIKERLGLEPDATPAEIQKAMKLKILEE